MNRAAERGPGCEQVSDCAAGRAVNRPWRDVRDDLVVAAEWVPAGPGDLCCEICGTTEGALGPADMCGGVGILCRRCEQATAAPSSAPRTASSSAGVDESLWARLLWGGRDV